MPETTTTFDAEAFLTGTETNEAGETQYTRVPEGDYIAIIDDQLRISEHDGTPIVSIDWLLTDDALKEKMGLQRLAVQQSFFVELTKDGKIANGPNKNIALNKTRDVFGLNKPGKTFNFNMLRGAGPALIHVVLGPGKKDPENLYNKDTRVAPLP